MPAIFTSWTFWLTVGAVVVVIAAALLVTILLVARSIRSEAARALTAVRRIEENTDPIWRLRDVLDGAIRIRAAAGRIADRTEGLARTVHGAGRAGLPGGGP